MLLLLLLAFSFCSRKAAGCERCRFKMPMKKAVLLRTCRRLARPNSSQIFTWSCGEKLQSESYTQSSSITPISYRRASLARAPLLSLKNPFPPEEAEEAEEAAQVWQGGGALCHAALSPRALLQPSPIRRLHPAFALLCVRDGRSGQSQRKTTKKPSPLFFCFRPPNDWGIFGRC